MVLLLTNFIGYQYKHLISFKVLSFCTYHLCQWFCYCWKHFLYEFFGKFFRYSFIFAWIISMSSNVFPFSTIFNWEKNQKSQGARSGEYGGCWITVHAVFCQKTLHGKSRMRGRIVVMQRASSSFLWPLALNSVS